MADFVEVLEAMVVEHELACVMECNLGDEKQPMKVVTPQRSSVRVRLQTCEILVLSRQSGRCIDGQTRDMVVPVGTISQTCEETITRSPGESRSALGPRDRQADEADSGATAKCVAMPNESAASDTHVRPHI